MFSCVFAFLGTFAISEHCTAGTAKESCLRELGCVAVSRALRGWRRTDDEIREAHKTWLCDRTYSKPIRTDIYIMIRVASIKNSKRAS